MARKGDGQAPSVQRTPVGSGNAMSLLGGFPVVIASSGTMDDACLITLAFVYPLSIDPPMLGVGINPRRHSHAYFEKHDDFSLSLVDEGLLNPAKFCGSRSGRDVDKWAGAGLAKEHGINIASPHVAQARAVIEVRKESSVETGDHTLFYGRVVEGAVSPDYSNTENIVYWKGRYCRPTPLS